ncbi:dTDP-4-dehydrorhamnose 3,5-epimerase [Patescibacteria group bacterium]|nr:dTDP-4-dehydrorhamnose 3,5-epimerase [Candidatus Falkowbacteria bacterium]MBU3906146.1 dTDP-4-dehydrorhamnose 3,5-epimerase [Patescibacteria group bacterium]MBU4014673.1 dTDP-4-dehydrorhamnose 3,5-epimerase [Patescibacteria group bacterium]MBU4026639.1 dTDP-4-dehydrorhamnose 3,5-epimerase [Patescibacteria group bacterium]MBU4073538.1 dTDP-4-dehydrorhamnose 3,5-epimerase [Patescibacteria group bacterium]
MKFKKTKLKGLYIIEPEPRIDERGYLMRTFCKEELNKYGLQFTIVQVNQTLTKKKGTVRGMHFQTPPKAEDKIVQCLHGAIYDVAIDLRADSPTYGKWVAEELNEDNKKMFFIPKGFAHGFQSLTNNCEVQYFMSEFYSPEHASGVRWDDSIFNIKWPIKNLSLSEKDKNWPLAKQK